MRSIIAEDEESQVQSDNDGREFIYRKDYISKGDGKTEFSLSLMYSREGRIPVTMAIRDLPVVGPCELTDNLYKESFHAPL